jgi:hypothetical protein
VAQSRDPAPVHRVALDTKIIESASTPPFEGPLTLSTYLFCFDNVTPPPTYPAYVEVALYQGKGVDFNYVWTVTAAATEIEYPEYPIQGAAIFETDMVVYDYSGQVVVVGFWIEGGPPGSPLRLAVMATLGKEPGAPAESVQSSAPRVVTGAYRVRSSQPTEHAHKDLGMRHTYRPSERPLHTISAEGGGLLPEGTIGGVIVGPLNVTSFLFCAVNQNEWVRPGFNTLVMDLRSLGIGTVWAVNADVTELVPPDTTWTGDATFTTLGVQLDIRNQRAFVHCRLDWGAALPVAVMMTLGYFPEPHAEGRGNVQEAAITQPDRPPENHDVTLPITSANAPLATPTYTWITGVHGPWQQAGYLFGFANPDQSNWANPGLNVFTIDLTGLNLGTVWTVNADVVELLSADFPEPHIGDARFETFGTTYNFPAQVASVTFWMDWDNPLPVGIMTNIGFTSP